MNKSLIFAFAFGAAVGSVVTWQLVKTKYAQLAQEEIDSVKEVFSNRENKNADSDEPILDNDMLEDEETPAVSHSTLKPSLAAYAKMLSEKGYTSYSNSHISLENENPEDMTFEPHVISYEEYGELDGYDVKSLNYYGDGVLTDDWDNVIEDIANLVGTEFTSRFGDGEQDIVYVRNDTTLTDYEIVYSPRAYTDIYTTPPGSVDDE